MAIEVQRPDLSNDARAALTYIALTSVTGQPARSPGMLWWGLGCGRED